MVRRKHVIAVLAVIAITYVTFLGIYFFTPNDIYIVSPPKGRVIDQDTQAPISDVSILAIWQMQGGIGMVTSWIEPLYMSQTQTDPEGYFQFKVPPFILYRSGAWNATLSGHQPVLFFLKSGYAPEATVNLGAPKVDDFFGKNLISVPVDIEANDDGLVKLHKQVDAREQLSVYADGLLDSLKSLLFPLVASCDVIKIEEFYLTYVDIIKTTDKARIEPYSAMLKNKTCGDRNYEYF